MSKIKVKMSFNERNSGRDTALARAIAEDTRFSLPEFADIKVDLKFIGEPIHHGHDLLGEEYEENAFQCELKQADDYVITVLGKDGHGAMQYLDMAESGHRCMFLVLGSDWEINRAIYDSLHGAGYRGSELAFQVHDYENRLRDFEANAFALHAPVFRRAVDKRKLDDENLRWPHPFQRLLSDAHKILTGGSLTGYGPRPKDNEREVMAANCLFRGIGSATLEEVLKYYQVSLTPRIDGARPVEEMPGVGKKRAELLNSRIVMIYGRGLQSTTSHERQDL